MPTLQIQLLGDFRLLYDDQPVMMAQHLRLQSLLAYLIVHGDAPQTRQRLAFLFWPDASEAQARANLRKTVHELRRLLPFLDAFLQIEEQVLQWRHSPASSVDVVRFAASLAQAEQASQPEMTQAALAQAVALYAGDLLPGCYDDWLLREREQLRQQYRQALEQLIDLHEQQREFATALTYAHRLLQADVLHESSYQRLMRLHVLNDDRAAALRIYHTCATALRQELGVEPGPETQQLYQRLLNAPTGGEAQLNATARAARGMLPLVGRQPEWQRLQAAWRSAAAGMAHCVLIAGEAGIGKTRLAEELRQWTDRQGYATVQTRSYAAEGRLAYAPLTDWLRAEAIRPRLPELAPLWLVETARLLPELLVERPELPAPAPLSDSWQRQRFREAVARAVLLGRQPLLLVIDDLQWCDGETLEWLRYFLRLAAQERLLVVGTVRPEEVGSDHPLTNLLLDLRQAGQLTEMELGPLTGDETAALATQVAGRALEPDQADSLYAQTEGHPLFVVEMLRASEKRETVSPQASRSASDSLPPKVQAVIQSRLAQLSAPARELAGLAAAVGRAFSIQVLAQAGEGDEDALVRGLDELWQRRLIREQGEDAYDFSHDKIREAAYAGVSRARRRQFHRRVAQALEQVHAAELDPISGELAAHYEQAGLPEQAVRYYQRAADVAQRIFAHAEATSHLRKGLGLLDHLPVSPDRLQQKLRLRLSLADSLTILKGMSAAEVKAVYEQALDLAMPVGDHSERFAALLGLFRSHLTRGQLQAAHDLAKQCLALAEQVGNASQLAGARMSLGVLLIHLGQWKASRTLLEQALDRSSDRSFYSEAVVPVQHRGVSSHRHLPVALWHLGYPDQALAQMDEVLARAEALADPYTSASIYSWFAWLNHYRREAALVQAQAEIAIAISLQHGFPYHLEQSDILLGWALAQQGQVEAGIARMQSSLAIRVTMDAHLHQPAFLALLAEVYGQAGQPEQGVRVLDEALSIAEVTGDRWSHPELYRLKGELLRRQGVDAQEVESHFCQALAVAQQQEAKSLELRAAMSLARLWQQQNQRQQARALLAEIYGWFTEGFHTPDLIEARALLEELA
jgi:DNA-binding SARP family transcriptional activator/tetratricopeptide (TPR) repeat protein